MIKAVLFDWDGTLADTMKSHYLAYKKALEGIIEIGPMDIYEREGGGRADIIRGVLQGKKLGDRKLRELMDRKSEIYAELSGGIAMRPGAGALVASLREKGIRIGLVTGTTRSNVESHLREGERSLFDAMVTVEDTDEHKPSPVPYLRCLEKLGASPEEAAAVENAPMGVESAKRAGIRCVAVTYTVPADILSRADVVVKGLEDVEGALERLRGA